MKGWISSEIKFLHSKLKFANSAIPLYTATSEVVVCIYGFAIELFYDEQGNETEIVVMKAGCCL